MLAGIFGGAGQAAEFSERDYFTEVPVVLTASRLAQPLDETPGAVTVIDRATIRRSGARELADVLRLVPGYLVGGWNGANPNAAYHAPLDEIGSRNLVLVDGRPVYSTYYLGDTHHGLMGVLLEDIERIEVLRGSNSATFGANAMFGVINIITRHSADTPGVELAVSGGEDGIADSYARVGWGDATANLRISAGRRSDHGYRNAHDDKIVSQLHLRADFRPALDQEWQLAVGGTELSAGEGLFGSLGNPERTTGWSDLYLHAVWQRQLSMTDQLKLTANIGEESFQDSFVDPGWGVTVSINGHGRRTNLELQHQLGISASLRAVWGIGYKQEEASSTPLYAVKGGASLHEERLFGNLEWRPQWRWLVNAGGFYGNHSWRGNYFSPRLMVNFHVSPDHTVRAGATQSVRMPTLFELAADVRYFPSAFPPGVPYRLYGANGRAAAEKLYVQEVGYFGHFREWHTTLDVRSFDERMRNLIVRQQIATGLPQILAGVPAFGFGNDADSFRVRGAEYQLRWQPRPGTELMLGQTFSRLIWSAGRIENQPPSHATVLALFHKLPGDIDVGLMYYASGAMSWGNATNDPLPPRHRLDARLAVPFRIGATRGELAWVVQAATGGYPEYLGEGNLTVPRRAFGTLRLEF